MELIGQICYEYYNLPVPFIADTFTIGYWEYLSRQRLYSSSRVVQSHLLAHRTISGVVYWEVSNIERIVVRCSPM